MKFGLYLVPTDAYPPITDLARAIEERGFDSIWVPEHSHIPTTGSTPYPGRGPVTRDFARTLDPFVALTAAATRHHETQARHRHLSADSARHDPHREDRRDARSSVRRPRAVRRRRRLEQAGDGEPRHRLRDALPTPGGTTAGVEEDLDRGRAGISRRSRRLRTDVVVAEAGLANRIRRSSSAARPITR